METRNGTRILQLAINLLLRFYCIFRALISKNCFSRVKVYYYSKLMRSPEAIAIFERRKLKIRNFYHLTVGLFYTLCSKVFNFSFSVIANNLS